MGKLEEKIALITGGSSGIGLATAQQFVNEGAYVFITGRRDTELAAAVKAIGRNVSAIQGDVARRRIHHPERVHGAIPQCLHRGKSRGQFARPDVDDGFEGSPNSGERNEPRRR